MTEMWSFAARRVELVHTNAEVVKVGVAASDVSHAVIVHH